MTTARRGCSAGWTSPARPAGASSSSIEGETWDAAGRPSLLGELRDLLGRLHEDRQLAGRLGDGPRGYRECWELCYREQFEEDLKTVRASRPASVAGERVSWMAEEARVVLALPTGNGAFGGVARSPCHGDLWPNNVLVGANGRPRVLDWDGLAVGDEAEDLAILVWPLVHETGADWAECDVPEWRDEVRRRKEEEHHRYLDWYLGRWG